jgi:amidohydrolase
MSKEMAQQIREAAKTRAGLTDMLWQQLHRMPELAHQEERTTRFVRDFLAQRGIEFRTASSGTGGVARIGQGELSLMLRADLDGLPIAEQTGLSCQSTHPGMMHACGHDAHTAILLTVADALISGAIPFQGSVALLFQPAEEGPGGCRDMIEAGLLDEHPATNAVALHVWPGMKTGQVGLTPGTIMAAMDMVKLKFIGKGGHGAIPHQCIDPVVMAAQAVVALQTLVSRTIDPLQPALFSLGTIHGGDAANVIPDEVKLEGTIRSYDEGAREQLIAGIERICNSVAAAHGGSAEVVVERGYPPTTNDPEKTLKLRNGLAPVIGLDNLLESTRTMGAEDMSFLLDRVGGCYLQLGCAEDPASAPILHNPKFAPDRACFPVGVAAMLTAVSVFAG